MQVETVRRILVSENLEETAKALPMQYDQAHDVQLHWLRRIAGRCAACGVVYEDKPVCPKCKKVNGRIKIRAPHPPKMFAMLSQVPVNKPLLRKKCDDCGKEFILIAHEVMDIHKRYGNKFFRQPWFCKSCLTKKYHSTLKYRPFAGLELKYGAEFGYKNNAEERTVNPLPPPGGRKEPIMGAQQTVDAGTAAAKQPPQVNVMTAADAQAFLQSSRAIGDLHKVALFATEKTCREIMKPVGSGFLDIAKSGMSGPGRTGFAFEYEGKTSYVATPLKWVGVAGGCCGVAKGCYSGVRWLLDYFKPIG